MRDCSERCGSEMKQTLEVFHVPGRRGLCLGVRKLPELGLWVQVAEKAGVEELLCSLSLPHTILLSPEYC